MRYSVNVMLLGTLLTLSVGASSADDDFGSGPVTFSEHIAPIFQKACQECHRPTQAAPMSLLTYEDARPWAKSIKQAVTEREMPPWFADPAHGTFVNDPRLSDEEIAAISRWVDTGSPEGDPALLPPPLTFVDGWGIGKPDAIVTMSEPYQLPAEGVIDYQEFEIMFPDYDVWVTKMEIRPSNPQAAHHINMFREEPLPNGRYGFRDFVTGYIPGGGPTKLPEGIALHFKAGTKLILQAHYVPTGEPTSDQTSVGFVFAREPVHQEIHLSMVGNYSFEIPPNDPNHEVRTRWTALNDIEVIGTYAHMHLRGKDFEFVAHYPDGKSEKLMSIPNYDFEWQLGYVFKDRPQLPKRTTVEIIAHLDNSPGNPFNPDPTATVRNGPQTWDEMVIGALFWVKQGEDIRGDRGAKDLWTAAP